MGGRNGEPGLEADVWLKSMASPVALATHGRDQGKAVGFLKKGMSRMRAAVQGFGKGTQDEDKQPLLSPHSREQPARGGFESGRSYTGRRPTGSQVSPAPEKESTIRPPVPNRFTSSPPLTRAHAPRSPPYQPTRPEVTPQQPRCPTGSRLPLSSNRSKSAVEKSTPRTGVERAGANPFRQLQPPPKNLSTKQTPAKHAPVKPTPVKPTPVKDTPARRELEFGHAGRRMGNKKLCSANGVAAQEEGATVGKKGASTTQATPGPASPSHPVDLVQQQIALETALAENARLLQDIEQLQTKVAAQSHERAELAARLNHVEVARAGLRSAADEAIRALEAESREAAAREEELALAVVSRAEAAAAAETKVELSEAASAVQQETARELERALLAARAGTTPAPVQTPSAEIARARGDKRAATDARGHLLRTPQEVHEPAVLEMERATAVIQKLLARHQQLANVTDVSLAELREETGEKLREVERAQLLMTETASQLKEQHDALLARAKTTFSCPPSPSSPFDTDQLERVREKAVAHSAGLEDDLAHCRVALAAKKQECAALSAQLAQLEREHAALLRMADEALSALEEGRPAAAAQRAQLAERARESERAAAAAEARVLKLESSLAAAISWVAELEEEADRLKMVEAAAAAQLKAERIAAATERDAAAAREGDLREEIAGLEGDSARLHEELDMLRADKCAQTAVVLAEQEKLEAAREELERAARTVAERESEVRAAKIQVIKLTRELKEAAALTEASAELPDATPDQIQLQLSDMRQLATDLGTKANDATAAAESAERRLLVVGNFLKEQLNEEREKAATLESELRVKKDELKRAKQRVEEMTLLQNMSAGDREARLHDQVCHLTTQIQVANDHIERLLADLQAQIPSAAPFLPDLILELERLHELLGGPESARRTALTPPIEASTKTSTAGKRAICPSEADFAEATTGWGDGSGPSEAAASGQKETACQDV
ncbi:hypothetical protein KFL_005950020 [Klebsormidium nitens]|uniref:Uncharacterized protein n=1 Tax=Klebsormidium nitens TaxID=105231 RepID=A0A1Y1IGQ5_KLENI|nr:hypothetical protein KFL_005950020 [Klebsormidium nitens]|eukprot:GAQ90064.1 hypothetical protein KFL_005950020 [Klebsormidium nitens]